LPSDEGIGTYTGIEREMREGNEDWSEKVDQREREGKRVEVTT
jgi:hypothetical protein